MRSTETWMQMLTTILPRRGVGRLVAAAFGITGLAEPVRWDDAAAKRKKKRKKGSRPATPCSGGCGPDEQCIENRCVPPCADRRAPCGGTCCAEGETCRNGACDVRCPSPPYIDCFGDCRLIGACCDGRPGTDCAERHAGEAGRWVCCNVVGNGCFDLDTDRFNCGACGAACGTNEICCGGGCRLGPGPCPPG
jgi:hypothetical protein